MDSENFWKIRETQINNCIISCSYIGVAPHAHQLKDLDYF